jgi:large subunit ribosomal protein L31
MKADIHPTWNNSCNVTCSCGATFTTGSTESELKVDICSKCHPFFTGEMRFVDEQGKVEKFQEKLKQAATLQAKRKDKAKEKASKAQAPKSLKEMLTSAKPAKSESAS